MRSVLIGAVRRVRFAVWARTARLRMKLAGFDLRIEGAPGVALYEFPRVRRSPEAGGGGSATLRFGPGVRVFGKIDFELSPEVHSDFEVGEQSLFYEGVAIRLRGGLMKLGSFVETREGVVLKNAGQLEIGNVILLSNNTIIHCTERITLADDVGIGERTTIVDSAHDVDGSDVYWRDQPVGTEPVSIGANTTTFANSVVMRGSHVGRNSVVAAGAIVTGGTHPDNVILAGAPARVLREVGRRES